MGMFGIWIWAIICASAILFSGAVIIAARFLKESRIRIVIDGNDMDSFLKVMRALKNDALGISYNDDDNVIMEVKVYKRKLNSVLAALNEIPNIDALEMR